MYSTCTVNDTQCSSLQGYIETSDYRRGSCALDIAICQTAIIPTKIYISVNHYEIMKFDNNEVIVAIAYSSLTMGHNQSQYMN